MADHRESVLPLGLRVRGRRVVVVGGGRIALRRVGALLRAGAEVVVVSPEVVAALEDLATRGQVQWLRRPYAVGDLDGAWLAMACTADAEVNAAVLQEADGRRVFCLRVDDARDASAWMPATGRSGPATVSVHGDRNPRRAAALRDAALAAVESALREGNDPGDRGDAPDGPGRVVLVGGGPGDPELLTLKGFQALATADVVVVDRLAPLAALDGLREGVEVVDVSKIPRGRFTPQEEINAVLVDRARRGLTVVRLKGGDPFVFGRGMEEVLACAEAGIATEVVPGVTSAVAAPGLAGIPVTHRGLSQGFTVISGHAAPDDPRSTVDWDALARGGTTLVVLMGVETLPAIARALLAAGRAGDTPVASIMDGGMPSQEVLSSTLAAVAGDGAPERLRPPAVTVIGAVAAFAAG